MKIVNHRLQQDDGTPFSYVRSPNVGGRYTPKYLIMHFTAGSSAQSSISWMTRANGNSSAHLVIGRDGKITQLVPFNTVAWHAGASAWGGLTGFNHHSIGIELDNAGPMQQSGGAWVSGFGRTYSGVDVIEAIHKNETKIRGWHTYTPEQLEAAVEVGMVLIGEYNLRNVLGHEDIAPKRKVDPGPAFPMESFRARVMGRAEDERTPYETTEQLNIRSGPGTIHSEIPGSPLPRGTRVERLDAQGSWWQVDVLDTINNVMDMQGWVHSRFLKRT